MKPDFISRAIGPVVVLVALMGCSSIRTRLLGEVPSPDKAYTLSIYEYSGALGFQGATTVFNLHKTVERVKYYQGHRAGAQAYSDGDIAVIDGHYSKYAVSWPRDRQLVIRSSHVPGDMIRWGPDMKKVFVRSMDSWKDVNIKFEILGGTRSPGEIEIDAEIKK